MSSLPPEEEQGVRARWALLAFLLQLRVDFSFNGVLLWSIFVKKMMFHHQCMAFCDTFMTVSVLYKSCILSGINSVYFSLRSQHSLL